MSRATRRYMNRRNNGLSVLARAAGKIGLPDHVAFNSTEGGTALVWDLPSGRTTIYVEPGMPYEVEHVPDGPLRPFVTWSPDAAAMRALRMMDL